MNASMLASTLGELVCSHVLAVCIRRINDLVVVCSSLAPGSRITWLGSIDLQCTVLVLSLFHERFLDSHLSGRSMPSGVGGCVPDVVFPASVTDVGVIVFTDSKPLSASSVECMWIVVYPGPCLHDAAHRLTRRPLFHTGLLPLSSPYPTVGLSR